MTTNADPARKLDALEKKYDAQFKLVFDAIRALMTPPPRGFSLCRLHTSSIAACSDCARPRESATEYTAIGILIIMSEAKIVDTASLRQLVSTIVLIAVGMAQADGPTGAAPADLKYGGKALADWVDALNAPDLTTRLAAADAVGHFGPAAAAAIPGLIDILKTDAAWGLDGWGGRTQPFVPSAFALTPPNGRLMFTWSPSSPRSRATVALRKIGPAAVPALLREAVKEESQFAPIATYIIEEFGPVAVPELVKTLNSPIDRVRLGAALLLAPQGPEAVRAIPLLAYETGRISGRDKSVSNTIIGAIGKIGPAARPAVPALVRVLEKGHRWGQWEDERVWAMNALSAIGPGAVDAVPALATALENSDADVRVAAANALKAIGPRSKAAVPALRARLEFAARHGKTYDRIEAADALWTIERDADAVVPTCVSLVNTGDWSDRKAAAQLLERIGGRAGAAANVLRQNLKGQDTSKPADVDAGALVAMASALWAIDPKAEDVLPVFTTALAHEHWSVRDAAARGLGRMGTAARPALPQLTQLLKDDQSDDKNGKYVVRIAAADAIWAIEHTPGLVVPTYISCLNYAIVADRVPNVIEGLARIGPDAAPAIPALIEYLNGPSGSTMAAGALHAIGRMGPAGRPAAPTVRKLLTSVDPLVRVSAAEALARIEERPDEPVAALISALVDPSGLVRIRTAQALGSLGPPAAASVPALMRGLTDEYAEVRLSAVTALGQIGPAARASLPAVRASQSDVDEGVRGAAAKALDLIRR